MSAKRLIRNGLLLDRKMLKGFCHGIDTINEWTGKVVPWLFLPLTILVVIEVVLRYVFNRPTIWAWDVNAMILGALVTLGGGYVLLHEGHIRVDILVQGLSPRKRAIADLIAYLFFFLGVGVLLWQMISAAQFAVQTRELWSTFWRPPIYPLRTAIALGMLLLFLEGIAKFIGKLIAVAYPASGDKA